MFKHYKPNLIKFSLAMMACFIAQVCLSQPTYANKIYDFEGFTKMSGSDVEALFTGRTFWGKNQYDRFFFGQDKSFAQQYVKAGQAFKPGATMYGTWAVDADGAVCFNYSSSNVGRVPEAQCFDVYMGPDKFKALPKYTDPLYLVKKGDTSKTTVEYFWSRWIDGRLVFDPSFAAKFEAHLSYMDAMGDRFDANKYRSTPPVKDVNALPQESQNFLKAISGKVLFTPYHYLYYGANGDYIYYDRGEFDANKSNIEALKGKAKRGRWIMFNNVHCWSLFGDRPRTSCQMIGQGTTLDTQFQGFVSHLDDGFSRLLNGNPVGIMEVSETGAPAAFQN